MAEDQAPVFQIQRIYLKDLSLEQPNSPGILLSQEQPSVDIQLALAAENVADGVIEVTVTATVTTKIQDKTVFLVEAKQAVFLKCAACPKTKWARWWALLARKSSTPICAATWPTWCSALAFRRCT